MARAFFSRVEPNTSFPSLITNAQSQIEAGRKPLDYNIIAEIFLSKAEFDEVLNNISLSIPQYKAHYVSSVASPDGVWQCIEIKCLFDDRTVIIYTAGRTFPLYAAPRILADKQ